jgi:hypothetical protein
MTALADATAALAADDTQIEQEVADLIAKLNAVPANNSAALQAALDAENVDAESQTAILLASDTSLKASIASAVAVLTPTPPSPSIIGVSQSLAGSSLSSGASLSNVATSLPTITSPNPVSVPGGSTVGETIVVSAGTIAPATSADGALSLDATGNLSGQAGPSGGGTTVAVVVTNSDGSTTSLVQSVNYT